MHIKHPNHIRIELQLLFILLINRIRSTTLPSEVVHTEHITTTGTSTTDTIDKDDTIGGHMICRDLMIDTIEDTTAMIKDTIDTTFVKIMIMVQNKTTEEEVEDIMMIITTHIRHITVETADTQEVTILIIKDMIDTTAMIMNTKEVQIKDYIPTTNGGTIHTAQLITKLI